MILAVVALIAGGGGFLAAAREPFADPDGSLLGKLLYFNRLGGSVTMILGAIALVGALARSRPMLLLAGAGFALAAALTIIQTGGDPNWLGGRGNTLSLFLAGAVGLLTLAVAPSAAGGPGDRGHVSSGSPGS